MAYPDFNPPVIAHRGDSAHAPENTIAAFTAAALAGVRWIEFDVMQAACGEPVIFHDETLDRTTNGHGRLADFPYAVLAKLDAGSWFDMRFSGERIPAFSHVLEFLHETKLCANIEIKALPGREEQLVRRVLLELSKTRPFPRGSILFSSFSIEALRLLRKYSQDCLLGLLQHEWDPDWEKICASLDCVSVHVNEAILTENKCSKIKRMGRALLSYTVNDPEQARRLFSWGVDAVFSDAPEQILSIL